MGSDLKDDPEVTQTQGYLDQYQRPSCRPIRTTEELRDALGPGTAQILQVLNQL